MYKTIIASALAAISMAAPAATPDETYQERAVSYADLNLSSEQGMRTLIRRIDGAIDHVCGNVPVREIYALNPVRACRQEAQDQADEQLSRVLGSVTILALQELRMNKG